MLDFVTGVLSSDVAKWYCVSEMSLVLVPVHSSLQGT